MVTPDMILCKIDEMATIFLGYKWQGTQLVFTNTLVNRLVIFPDTVFQTVLGCKPLSVIEYMNTFNLVILISKPFLRWVCTDYKHKFNEFF